MATDMSRDHVQGGETDMARACDTGLSNERVSIGSNGKRRGIEQNKQSVRKLGSESRRGVVIWLGTNTGRKGAGDPALWARCGESQLYSAPVQYCYCQPVSPTGQRCPLARRAHENSAAKGEAAASRRGRAWDALAVDAKRGVCDRLVAEKVSNTALRVPSRLQHQGPGGPLPLSPALRACTASSPHPRIQISLQTCRHPLKLNPGYPSQRRPDDSGMSILRRTYWHSTAPSTATGPVLILALCRGLRAPAIKQILGYVLPLQLLLSSPSQPRSGLRDSPYPTGSVCGRRTVCRAPYCLCTASCTPPCQPTRAYLCHLSNLSMPWLRRQPSGHIRNMSVPLWWGQMQSSPSSSSPSVSVAPRMITKLSATIHRRVQQQKAIWWNKVRLATNAAPSARFEGAAKMIPVTGFVIRSSCGYGQIDKSKPINASLTREMTPNRRPAHTLLGALIRKLALDSTRQNYWLYVEKSFHRLLQISFDRNLICRKKNANVSRRRWLAKSNCIATLLC
jgi:hypothetical protein